MYSHLLWWITETEVFTKRIPITQTTCRFFSSLSFFPFWRMLWTNSIGSFSKENIFTENSETRLSPLKTRHSYIKSNLEKSLTNPFWCKYPVWKNKSTKKKVIWFFGKITLAHMVFKFRQTEAKSLHFPPFCKNWPKRFSVKTDSHLSNKIKRFRRRRKYVL